MPENQTEEIAVTALRKIASGAVRCVPCGMRGITADAATMATRYDAEGGSVTIPLCSACYIREATYHRYDSLSPVTQPKSVTVAREALAQIEALRPRATEQEEKFS